MFIGIRSKLGTRSKKVLSLVATTKLPAWQDPMVSILSCLEPHTLDTLYWSSFEDERHCRPQTTLLRLAQIGPRQTAPLHYEGVNCATRVASNRAKGKPCIKGMIHGAYGIYLACRLAVIETEFSELTMKLLE